MTYEKDAIIQDLRTQVADLEAQLYAIGAGGVGSAVTQQDHLAQLAELAPAGWKLVPVEQPQVEQEPICLVTGYYGGRCTVATFNGTTVLPVGMALYTSPQSKLRPLTDEDVEHLWHDEAKLWTTRRIMPFEWYQLGICRAEEAHGITGETK